MLVLNHAHAMKVYEEVEVQCHTFLILVPDKKVSGQLLCPSHFTLRERTHSTKTRGDCVIPRQRHITWEKIQLLAMLTLSCAAHSIVPNRTELSQFPSITVTLSVMAPENLNSGITF